MNKTIITSSVTGIFLSVSSIDAMACLSCATEVTLTEADAVCLSSRIDDLVIEAEETDSVLVVLDCGLEESEVAGGGGDRAHAGPATPEIKTVSPAETGGEAAAPTFFILSRLQLKCLQETFCWTGWTITCWRGSGEKFVARRGVAPGAGLSAISGVSRNWRCGSHWRIRAVTPSLTVQRRRCCATRACRARRRLRCPGCSAAHTSMLTCGSLRKRSPGCAACCLRNSIGCRAMLRPLEPSTSPAWLRSLKLRRARSRGRAISSPIAKICVWPASPTSRTFLKRGRGVLSSSNSASSRTGTGAMWALRRRGAGGIVFEDLLPRVV